jgi:hypothetical protein
MRSDSPAAQSMNIFNDIARVASPWSVTMTKRSPARSAAAAMSSIDPLPSDRDE